MPPKYDVESIIKTADQLDGNRINWEDLWQICADFCMPENSNINIVRARGDRRGTERFIDIGIRANEKLASGMYSHLINLQQRTFKYRAKTKALNDDESIKAFFSTATDIIHEGLLSSNFILENHEFLQLLGCVGTSIMYSEKGNGGTLYNFRNYHVKDCLILENSKGLVDTIFRRFEYTPRQAEQEFGEDKLAPKMREMLSDPKQLETEFKFIHAVYPNNDYKEGVEESKFKRFSSKYIDVQHKMCVSEGGYNEFPYEVTRMMKDPTEIYGRSAAMQILSTLKSLNVMKKDILNAAEQIVNPQWLIPNNGSVGRISQKGGALIHWNNSNPQNKPERLPANGEIGIGAELMAKEEQDIREAFYNDLFDVLSDRRNMTATEVVERVGEKLVLFNPVVGRIQSEYLKPLFERLFFIALRSGALGELPDALKQDPNFEVEFSGKLSMAIQEMEIISLAEGMNLIGQMAQFFPGILDNFNEDEIARDVSRSKNWPERWIKNPEVRDEARAARAAQAAQMQSLDDANKMADIVSKTQKNTEPNSPLSQMGDQLNVG